MSTSGKNVGTRKYLKRADPKPRVNNDGVAATVASMIGEIEREGEAAGKRPFGVGLSSQFLC